MYDLNEAARPLKPIPWSSPFSVHELTTAWAKSESDFLKSQSLSKIFSEWLYKVYETVVSATKLKANKIVVLKAAVGGSAGGFVFKPSTTHLLVLHLHWNTACCVCSSSFSLLLNFCRWVSPARRPIRTSWTSRALNALSSCQRGKHSGEYCIRFCAPIVSCKLTSAACFHSSATERDEWLEAIAKAIDDYTKKKITFISSRSQEEVRTWRLCGWTVW